MRKIQTFLAAETAREREREQEGRKVSFNGSRFFFHPARVYSRAYAASKNRDSPRNQGEISILALRTRVRG